MVLAVFLIILSCIIIWRSSGGFELASDYLGRRLPPGIKGATLNAIASSMPEFLTTIFFLFYLDKADGFAGGLGVTSGSALFNLLIIPALVVLVLSYRKGHKVKLNKKVLLREGLVLLISQVIFIDLLFRGVLEWHEGLILVMVYLVYLVGLLVITKRHKKRKSNFVAEETIRKNGFFTALIQLDIPALLLNNKRINTRRAWLLLLVSTLVMTAGTWMLVHGTALFGDATGIPLIFVSVVLSAAATSVPDTVISIKDAKKGNYDDAVSNALGSNIFDIAFALGFPVLLYTLIKGKNIVLLAEDLAFTQEVWVFLLLATFMALAIMLIGKTFNRLKAYLLLLIYVVFLLFVGTQLEESWSTIGEPIGHFLTELANRIGNLLQ